MESTIPALISNDQRVSVGRYSYGNPKFLLWSAAEKITIGSFCSIAEEVKIFGGGEHNCHWVTTFPLRIAFDLEGAHGDGHPKSKGPTNIGHDVWIGYGASILSGVHIGDGAVIGAGTVVSKDVPPYAIVAGNPCGIVRYRFSKQQIHKLLTIKWWDWPIEKILDRADQLCNPDIDDFIACALQSSEKQRPLLTR